MEYFGVALLMGFVGFYLTRKNLPPDEIFVRPVFQERLLPVGKTMVRVWS